MKIRVLIACSVIFTSLVFAQTEVGFVENCTGSVFLIIQNQKTSAKKGLKVTEGVRITTGPESRAVIKLNTGSIINIAPQTSMIINAHAVKKTDGTSVAVGVLSGKIGIIAKLGKNDKFEVGTPTVIAGVRGTEFEVATAIDGSGAVKVTEGTVAAETDGKSKDVAAGSSTASKIGTDGQLIEDSAAADSEAWLAEKNKSMEKDPVQTVKNMTARMQTIEKSSKELADTSEKMAKEENKTLEEEKKQADGLDTTYTRNITGSMSIYENAKAIADQLYTKHQELKTQVGGIERMYNAITALNARIDAALARVDERIAKKTQQINESFDKKETEIEKKFNRFNQDKDSIDKMFDSK